MKIQQVGSVVVDLAIFLFLVSSIVFAVTSNKEKAAISTLKKPVVVSQEQCLMRTYVGLEMADKINITYSIEDVNNAVRKCETT
ncbi:hypothetical protein [Alcanivorax sp.]|uniref:hypothetical protein n=1 Tax=Alcanivorax sp. TaxID=1872427 RepID=UPI0025BC5D6D|nr:hypothetical protein [Alcanivorax sp.]